MTLQRLLSITGNRLVNSGSEEERASMTRWAYESADCITVSHVSFLLRTLYRYTIPHRALIHHTSQKRIKGKKKRKGRKRKKTYTCL